MSSSMASPRQYPVACRECHQIKGFPYQVRTVTGTGSIEVKLRCRDCGHEWVEVERGDD